MKKITASEINKYIEALEGLVEEKEIKTEKTNEEILDMLKTALADEWLAAYQYWVCANSVRGAGRTDVVPEFEQHYKEEMEHVEKIMNRIKELHGTPITNPEQWIEIANPWTEVVTTKSCEQLDITIQAEKDAIAYYNAIIEYCKGFDEVTMRVCRDILADETEHLYDLEMLKEDICG